MSEPFGPPAFVPTHVDLVLTRKDSGYFCDALDLDSQKGFAYGNAWDKLNEGIDYSNLRSFIENSTNERIAVLSELYFDLPSGCTQEEVALRELKSLGVDRKQLMAEKRRRQRESETPIAATLIKPKEEPDVSETKVTPAIPRRNLKRKEAQPPPSAAPVSPAAPTPLTASLSPLPTVTPGAPLPDVPPLAVTPPTSSSRPPTSGEGDVLFSYQYNSDLDRQDITSDDDSGVGESRASCSRANTTDHVAQSKSKLSRQCSRGDPDMTVSDLEFDQSAASGKKSKSKGLASTVPILGGKKKKKQKQSTGAAEVPQDSTVSQKKKRRFDPLESEKSGAQEDPRSYESKVRSNRRSSEQKQEGLKGVADSGRGDKEAAEDDFEASETGEFEDVFEESEESKENPQEGGNEDESERLLSETEVTSEGTPLSGHKRISKRPKREENSLDSVSRRRPQEGSAVDSRGDEGDTDSAPKIGFSPKTGSSSKIGSETASKAAAGSIPGPGPGSKSDPCSGSGSGSGSVTGMSSTSTAKRSSLVRGQGSSRKLPLAEEPHSADQSKPAKRRDAKRNEDGTQPARRGGGTDLFPEEETAVAETADGRLGKDDLSGFCGKSESWRPGLRGPHDANDSNATLPAAESARFASHGKRGHLGGGFQDSESSDSLNSPLGLHTPQTTRGRLSRPQNPSDPSLLDPIDFEAPVEGTAVSVSASPLRPFPLRALGAPLDASLPVSPLNGRLAALRGADSASRSQLPISPIHSHVSHRGNRFQLILSNLARLSEAEFNRIALCRFAITDDGFLLKTPQPEAPVAPIDPFMSDSIDSGSSLESANLFSPIRSSKGTGEASIDVEEFHSSLPTDFKMDEAVKVPIRDIIVIPNCRNKKFLNILHKKSGAFVGLILRSLWRDLEDGNPRFFATPRSFAPSPITDGNNLIFKKQTAAVDFKESRYFDPPKFSAHGRYFRSDFFTLYPSNKGKNEFQDYFVDEKTYREDPQDAPVVTGALKPTTSLKSINASQVPRLPAISPGIHLDVPVRPYHSVSLPTIKAKSPRNGKDGKNGYRSPPKRWVENPVLIRSMDIIRLTIEEMKTHH